MTGDARRSTVVTGGGRGVGRAIVERLVESPDDAVVIVELEASAVGMDRRSSSR